jgi:hypothetical protein
MSNKHEAREPGTKPIVWPGPSMARSGFMRARAGPARISGPGQETRHGGLARHDPFISKPVKPAFFTLKRAYRHA